MKVCIYGGQYGSEGKGSASEYFALNHRSSDLLVAAGENAPNSGHTCSLGKTRNIPAASFYADVVLLGPDSIISQDCLREDIANLERVRGKRIPIYIHEHAGILADAVDKDSEEEVVRSISSTGSGSGYARHQKYFHRYAERTIGHNMRARSTVAEVVYGEDVHILNRQQYLYFIEGNRDKDWIFECSQGLLLDTNWGVYPFVTSRTTIPDGVLSRNGFGQWTRGYTSDPFKMVGVFRTFPIRTGGPSGPTGGEEVTFESIGVQPEIATVTKRVRRIFEFSRDDFYLSVTLQHPDIVAITHMDYLDSSARVNGLPTPSFHDWMRDNIIPGTKGRGSIIASYEPGQFETISL